jgi:hypothetical protein
MTAIFDLKERGWDSLTEELKYDISCHPLARREISQGRAGAGDAEERICEKLLMLTSVLHQVPTERPAIE